MDPDFQRFKVSYSNCTASVVLQEARQSTQEKRNAVTSLWLNNSDMEMFPDELTMIFPNIEGISLEHNYLRTIPIRLCSMTKLQWLWLHVNQLQCLPSAMTRLTNLRQLLLSDNAALPTFHIRNTWSRDDTQLLLQRIGAHYGPIEAACRRTIVTLLGVRKFRPIPAFAFIGRDVMAIIGKMMWNDCVNGEWVVAPNK